jgi:hypothetical protein
MRRVRDLALLTALASAACFASIWVGLPLELLLVAFGLALVAVVAGGASLFTSRTGREVGVAAIVVGTAVAVACLAFVYLLVSNLE